MENQKGWLFRHFKGGIYIITNILPNQNEENPYGDCTIVYMEVNKEGKEHTRTHSNFFGKVEAGREDNVTGQTYRFERFKLEA